MLPCRPFSERRMLRRARSCPASRRSSSLAWRRARSSACRCSADTCHSLSASASRRCCRATSRSRSCARTRAGLSSSRRATSRTRPARRSTANAVTAHTRRDRCAAMAASSCSCAARPCSSNRWRCSAARHPRLRCLHAPRALLLLSSRGPGSAVLGSSTGMTSGLRTLRERRGCAAPYSRGPALAASPPLPLSHTPRHTSGTPHLRYHPLPLPPFVWREVRGVRTAPRRPFPGCWKA